MRASLLFISFLLMMAAASAQSGATTIDDAVSTFLGALSNENTSMRNIKMEKIMADQGGVQSVNLSANGSKLAAGSYADFLKKSESFYERYDMEFEELERSISYYADIATVSSFVTKRVIDKASKQLQSEQKLWMTLELIYDAGNWHIANAAWINEAGNLPLQNQFVGDTLWHQLGR